jgi:hypothetical protein
MTLDDVLSELRAAGDPERAAGSAAYHKVKREYLGVAVPQIDEMAKRWRAELTLEDRLALAGQLWPRGAGCGGEASQSGADPAG